MSNHVSNRNGPKKSRRKTSSAWELSPKKMNPRPEYWELMQKWQNSNSQLWIMCSSVWTTRREVAPFRCLGLTSGSTALTAIRFKLRSIQTFAIQTKIWKCDLDIKLHVVSNGWVDATKMFMSNTNQTSIFWLPIISTQVSTHWLIKRTLKRFWSKSVNNRKAKFITKFAEEAKAAKDTRIKPILVVTHRRNIQKLDESDKQMTRIQLFNELEFE